MLKATSVSLWTGRDHIFGQPGRYESRPWQHLLLFVSRALACGKGKEMKLFRLVWGQIPTGELNEYLMPKYICLVILQE